MGSGEQKMAHLIEDVCAALSDPHQRDVLMDGVRSRVPCYTAAAAEGCNTRLTAAYRASLLALDMFPIGIVLLRSDRKSEFSNYAATRILEQDDGLCVDRHGRHCATVQREDALLQSEIEAALAKSGRAHGGGSVLRLSRSNSRKPLSVLIRSPIDLVPCTADPLATMFISDPESAPTAVTNLLSYLHDLTRAEAQMAAALIRGSSLSEYAVRRGITRNTAKSQLRQILAKTGAHRQADLVRIVLTSPAVLSQHTSARL